jgi:tetratricopeptide (TPR) repeat protein
VADFRALLRSGVAAACIVSVAAPATLPTVALAAASPLQVRTATAKEFTRVEFHWSGGAKVSHRRNGQTVTLRFSRDANPDLSTLKVFPPKWLKGANARHVGGALEVDLLLADDADARVGAADGAVFVNLFEKKAAPEAPKVAEAEPAAPEPAARPPRLNPVPAGGVVPVKADLAGPQMSLRFDWANPASAAVFRRGEALWIVFDAPARLDVSKLPRGVSQYAKVQAFKGRDYSALRLVVPRAQPIAVVGDGASWTVQLGPGRKPDSGKIAVQRDGEAAEAALTAVLSGATAPVWLDDPAVGDRIAVVPALGPAKALTARRDYVEMALLPTMHGLAIEPYATDLKVLAEGDIVRIGRPAGLNLSSSSVVAQDAAPTEDGAPKAAGMPGLIDTSWAKVGPGGFMPRYAALTQAAADEAEKGDDAPVEARLALARFLVGAELGYEAIGVLNGLARQRETIAAEPEFRGLRGIARAMVGRDKEAETDFATPVLGDDPSVAAWRGYLAARAGQWADARARFGAGQIAINQFPPVWKARFLRADAEAALQLADYASAEDRIREALDADIPPEEQLAIRLVQAKVFEARGNKKGALGIYKAIARGPLDQLATPALLRATNIELELGRISPADAAATYDGLRFRWRGDSTELESIRALGQLYLNQGRYREALESFRSAGPRLPDLPAAMELQNDLSNTFRSLFLDGLADGLEPVQALALFYDFKELTPIGADGDLMVRRLVRRLVDVDLLNQAADLLQYQVDNRLDGVPRAQVSTDLALIQLMNRKPEQALLAINNSRTTVLPPALNAERRVITARALLGVGRLDAAEEMIEPDNSPEARDVRAEIAWKARNWALAGSLFEGQLADRWKSPLPLKPDEESRLLRAGVAYSLAGDDASLARLRERFDGFVEGSRNPEALRVAFAAADGGTLTTADFSRAVADNEGFTGWVSRMKQKFREKPSPTGAPVRTAENAGTRG